MRIKWTPDEDEVQRERALGILRMEYPDVGLSLERLLLAMHERIKGLEEQVRKLSAPITFTLRKGEPVAVTMHKAGDPQVDEHGNQLGSGT